MTTPCIRQIQYFKRALEWEHFLTVYRLITLKSDSHVSENFCQMKVFPSLVWKNTIICLFGVSKWKYMNFKILFSWQTGWFKNKLCQVATFRIDDYLYVNSKIWFLLKIGEYFQNNVQLLANELQWYMST